MGRGRLAGGIQIGLEVSQHQPGHPYMLASGPTVTGPGSPVKDYHWRNKFNLSFLLCTMESENTYSKKYTLPVVSQSVGGACDC